MHLAKLMILLTFFICNKAEQTTNVTIIEEEPNNILRKTVNKAPRKAQANNENSLEDDISEILKELNIIPSNSTTTTEPVSIPEDQWNITRDFPSNEQIGNRLSAPAPSQPDQHKPSTNVNGNTPTQFPYWATVTEKSPTYSYPTQPDPHLHINHVVQKEEASPAAQSNYAHQQSSWTNKGLSFSQLPHAKNYQSNYFTSHQTHGVQTISNHLPQPFNHKTQSSNQFSNSNAPLTISNSYLPVPVAQPQNPAPWMPSHCQCQSYYNPFSSFSNYPTQFYSIPDSFYQYHDTRDSSKPKSA